MERLRARVTPTVAIALLLAIAVVRMASTYRVFSATADEATHVGAGLELLQFHVYQLQPENPPLARIVFAALPFLAGMRYEPHASTFGGQLHSVFYGSGDYIRNVALARTGNLVFFLIAALAVAAWARRELGAWEAVLAVLFFTMQPVILGYSSLATHDAAATAGTAVALAAMSRWLARRDARTAVLLGVAYGFAIVCKFSCVAYVPLACGAIYIVRLLRDETVRRGMLRDVARIVAVVPLVAFVVTWAAYAFTVGKFGDILPWREVFTPAIAHLVDRVDPSLPLPAPHFFTGLLGIIHIDRAGFLSYAFGDISMRGWWWYFPVAVLLKTTLPLLLLIIGGVFFVRGEHRWRTAEALLAALAILALATRSTLDIGVRYVLPMYAPLVFAAAAIASSLLRNRQRVVRHAAVALLVCDVAVSAVAHPDYFPFFNSLAGRDPAHYLVDSNIDWGQDVLRLRSAARELQITHLATSLMGPADLAALHFPPTSDADPHNVQPGWLAVSEQSYRLMGWTGLADRPYRRIGRSIRLYYIR
jgi:4-amino-4-deoxy-L-arabinose transferase-like glycosyltransferase